MSLINKLLNDLEKRDAFLKDKHDPVLEGLYSAYDLELAEKTKSNKLLLILISIFVLSLLLIFLDFEHKNNNKVTNTNNYEEVIPVVKEERKSIGVTEQLTSNKNIENIKDKNNHILKLDNSISIEQEENYLITTKLNKIESIKFDIDDSEINLIMNMTEEIDYLVYGLNNPDRTVIEIENTTLGFKLEELAPVDPIVAIRYSINENNKLKLVLESESPLTIKKSMTSPSGITHDLVVMMESQWQYQYAEITREPEVNLTEFIEKQIADEVNTIFKGEIVKTPVNKGSDAYAEKLYQEAYRAYKNGEISESLKKLNMSLNQFAGHVKARSTLALILSKQGHLELAYSVLNEGLIQYPGKIEWVSLYARFLMNQEKFVESYSMLTNQTPDLYSNTDYYALQAAVSQKLNSHEEAAKIYRNLLKVNPQKAIWWMGLGISLETMKRYNDALYAYQKASNNSSLANDSRKFLLQRINRLSSLLEDEST
jgi:Tfp pilus assembly protein PilF